MCEQPNRGDQENPLVELDHAREREAATREILQVISQSRDDVQPVFDVVLEMAARLCGAPFTCLFLTNAERTHLTIAAYHGTRSKFVKLINNDPLPLDPSQSISAQAIVEKRPIQVADFRDTPIYHAGQPHRVHAVEVEGIRTVLAVPLLGGDEAIGVILLYRREVAPFKEDEIALVQTFAAQAVIAIENVRQFRELQSQLEREAATRDVLEVISKNRNNEQPVFDRIVDLGQKLSGAYFSVLILGREGDDFQRLVASRNVPDAVAQLFHNQKFAMDPAKSITPNAIIDKKVTYIKDMAESKEYLRGDERFIPMVDDMGIRSNLFVPLIHDGEGIGALSLAHKEVRAYTPDEILLMQTFAAQAVIAIENVRQFKALEQLNAELGDRVDEQVGEIERMGRLKRFLPSAVVDTVISQGSEKMLACHRAMLGVLFCDIRGFTAFCETAEPEETIEVLQTYHEEMGALIAAHGAGVDTRAGDGIMVLFNDPLPCDDPAGNALRLGLAMGSRMQELCKTWKRHGHKLGFGVGISLGYATVGMVGSEGRYDYTASGTAVNLAARLCDKAADGEILLSPRAYSAVGEDFSADSIGEHSLKGIHAQVEVFRVSGET